MSYVVFLSIRIGAEKYSYLTCMLSQEGADDSLPPFLSVYSKPLGPPQGPAQEIAPNVWQRKFLSKAGTTVVTYDNTNSPKGNGTICWAGEECTYELY